MNKIENDLFEHKPDKKKQKDSLSLYSLNKKQEEIKKYTNENKKKSKKQDKIDELINITKEESGYKIGHYLIKKTIGKGSFGKVKLGIYLPNKEKVAIKILDKKRIIEKDDLIRIKREFEMLSKFDHPNIILIAEIFETEKRYYSVMEYCEGGELFNYIVKKGHLNEEEASFFFYQLISGLEYIHSLGIVHRDLKPENLLLTGNNLLKIIDFGLSNYHTANSDLLLETPCGSPCYASPEMVSGLRYDGYKIDIWSCGVILFAMLCGYLPFENNNNNELFKKILSCKVKLPEYLSKESKDLILKILVKDPNKRLSINEIKNHPFYMKGKNIFHSNFEIEQINFNNTYEKKNKNDENIINDKDIKNKNKKILIIENINSINDEQNNNKNNCISNNINNFNIMTYQPILTDYDNHESKFTLNKKVKQLKKNLNSVNNNNNNKRVKSSNTKNRKNKSSNKTKDNFNIIELLKMNILTTNKKTNNLPNKKSHKIIVKNFSSGNLMKKINSILKNNKNTKSNINTNPYERIVMHTDTNSKNKENSSNYIIKNTNSNNKKIKGNNIIHKKINNITKLNKKGFNYLNILNKNHYIKNVNKANKIINNLFDRYIHKIIDKKSTNNSKNKKHIGKSKEKVIKLTKKSDNSNENIENKNINKLFNNNIDKSNGGKIDSEVSSYIVNTEPNQYFTKLSNSNNNSNILFKEIIKNINIDAGRKKLTDNKLKNNLQLIKQKSIPTLTDFSDYIFRNYNIKKNLTTKNRKQNKINYNYINKQKLNLHNNKKNNKKIHNNSLTKKNYFFTIRNTMINLNIHTPSVIISGYNKKTLNNRQIKKYNSNFKFSDIINNENDSISKNEVKNKKKLLFAKTGIKNNKNKIEYDQFQRHCNTNKNDDINNKINSNKIRNFRDKLILPKKCNLNSKNDKNNNKKSNNKIFMNKKNVK